MWFIMSAGETEIITSVSGRQYELGGKLGDGGYATVLKCTDSDTRVEYACKVINVSSADPKQHEKIERETQILRCVHDTEPNHQYVLSLIDRAFPDRFCCLILPLVNGGNLLDRIKPAPLSEDEARHVFAQVTIAIQFLHMKNICHRDIKPDNVLCSNKGPVYDIVVADFGLSKIFGELITQVGTLEYVAPEILVGKPYTNACDMWSLGCSMYACLTGIFPFCVPPEDEYGNKKDQRKIRKEQRQLIMEGKYNVSKLEEMRISPEACDLIRRLIQVDPTARLTPEGVLEHPWLREVVNRMIEEGKYTPPSMIEKGEDENGLIILCRKSSSD